MRRKRMKMEPEFKTGKGLPRGEKVIIKIGHRQADASLNPETETWSLKLDTPDLPKLEFPSLENAVLSAVTILQEDRI
jgi:hypothetical protein